MMKIIDTITDKYGREYIAAVLGTESLIQLSEAELKCFPGDPWTAGMLEDTLKNCRSTVIGALERQTHKIIGYGVLYTAGDEADIANMAVLPESRGCGIGYSLLSKMVEIARSMGVNRLFLEVRESNAPAIGLYCKLGFVKIGKRRNYYTDPREDAAVMVLGENI